jgi:proteic killer suppression protein
MQINYKSSKLQELCSDIRKATKAFNADVAEKLLYAVNFIEMAESLMDVRNYPPFHFHQLKNNKKGLCSIYLGKKLGYRLLVIPLLNGEKATPEEIFGSKAVEIKIIKIEEVSNHYE